MQCMDSTSRSGRVGSMATSGSGPSIPDDVRQIDEWFPPSDRSAAYELVARLPAGRRVQMTVVKVAEGSIERLPGIVATAAIDRCDVVAWAEYPRQLAAGGSAVSSDPRGHADRVARDRAGHERWLATPRPTHPTSTMPCERCAGRTACRGSAHINRRRRCDRLWSIRSGQGRQ